MTILNPPKNFRSVLTKTCSNCEYLCQVNVNDMDSEVGCLRNVEDDYAVPDQAEAIHWSVCDYFKMAEQTKKRDGSYVRTHIETINL